jgi:hypothetical protein
MAWGCVCVHLYSSVTRGRVGTQLGRERLTSKKQEGGLGISHERSSIDFLDSDRVIFPLIFALRWRKWIYAEPIAAFPVSVAVK